MGREHEAKPRHVLWHRRNQREPWQQIATASKEALMPVMAGLPTGESITLPQGEHPNERRSTSVKKTSDQNA
jgi:hypothetical protein